MIPMRENYSSLFAKTKDSTDVQQKKKAHSNFELFSTETSFDTGPRLMNVLKDFGKSHFESESNVDQSVGDIS